MAKAILACFSLLFIATVLGQTDTSPEPTGDACNQALGLESGAIADGRITASSSLNELRSPRYARLHQRDGDGGWTEDPNDNSASRLTIDLGHQARVVAVATQGRYDSNEYVQSYKLAYSDDGGTWTFVMDGNTEKEFDGNTNSDDVVKRTLDEPIEARYIRFMPTAFRTAVSMRVELYGCLTGAYTASFDGTNYFKWDLTQPRDTLNLHEELIEFQFLTSEPNGVILSGYGIQRDFLVLALVDGKLQLSIDLGTNSVYSDGATSMTVGSLLDDNHWHYVRYVRTKHRISVYIDGDKVRGEANGDFASLNLDKELTLGGVSPTAKYIHNFEHNFKGCLQNVLISNSDDPSVLGIALDFIEEIVIGGRSAFSAVGDVVLECSSADETSVTFPTVESYLKWPVSGSSNNFTVHIRFRTFDDDSLILYNAMNVGFIALGLRQSAFIVTIKSGSDNQYIDIPASFGLNDGLWHRVRVEVAAGRVLITVNGVEQSIPRDTGFVSTSSEFYIGGTTLPVSETAYLPGFRGCISEIHLQNTAVDIMELESSTLPSGVVNNGLQVDTCALMDWCSPSPCEHGGMCSSEWDTFVCDCTGTGYVGSVCHTSDYYHLCEHKSGPTEEITIDVDGSGPLMPFTVNCFVDGETLYRWTEITHDTEMEMDVPSGYEAAGSYMRKIEYTATLEQIDKLIESSEVCEQFVQYTCNNARLLNSPSGTPYGWWVSRHDQKMVNWGGAAAGTGRCACGVDMTCAPDNAKYCNCDASSTSDGVDEGYLMEKEYLPVTQLKFGDTGDSGSSASYRLGRMRCRGDTYVNNVVSFVQREAHLAADVEATNEGTMDVTFEFKTTFDPADPSKPATSAVFFSANAEDDGLIEVKLINDRTVQLQFDYGADLTTVTSTVSSALNDDEWHTIRANFDRRETWLQVDSNGAERMTLPRPELTLELEGPLFIGSSTVQSDGFVGCMRKMRVNGDLVDMAHMAEHSRDVLVGCVGQCSTEPCMNGGTCNEMYDSVECNCDDTAFTGTYCSVEVGAEMGSGSRIAYTVPQSLRIATSEDTVGLAFKTTQAGGQLFLVNNQVNSAHINIALNAQGNVVLKVQLDSGHEEIFTESKNFADNKNHFVKVMRNEKTIDFRVDDYTPQQRTVDAFSSNTFSPENIYVGNSNDNNDGFVGCISRVQFNSILPLKMYSSSSTIAGFSQTGPISGSRCGIQEVIPMLLPPEDYPVTPAMTTEAPKPSAAPVSTSLAAGDKAAIAIVVLLLIGALVLLLFLIGRYTSRHKGMYTTNEDRGAKNAQTADDAVALQGTGSKRTKEYYM